MNLFKRLFCKCDNEYILKIEKVKQQEKVWSPEYTRYLLTVTKRCKKCELETFVTIVKLNTEQFEAFKKFGAWEKFKETRYLKYIHDWEEYYKIDYIKEIK